MIAWKIYRMKKSALALLLAVCSLPALAQKITVGTHPFYQPFEYYNEQNQLAGFDIELMQALCDELHAECQFTPIAFDNLVLSLKSRKIDAAVSGMDITPERQQQVNFAGPYYQNSATFIVPTAAGITQSE